MSVHRGERGHSCRSRVTTASLTTPAMEHVNGLIMVFSTGPIQLYHRVTCVNRCCARLFPWVDMSALMIRLAQKSHHATYDVLREGSCCSGGQLAGRFTGTCFGRVMLAIVKGSTR